MSRRELSTFEQESPIPKIITLGDEVTYRVLYDAQEEAEGAVRYTDHTLLEQCRASITALHERAEPMKDYFVREVVEVGTPHAR
ncbi:DUF6879 family protein [Nocardiopsis alba]|uniref:DUF6879 family protein n=1 Tax=Nocardiopsis alba TaxID=53437 RepID=UPI0033D13530